MESTQESEHLENIDDGCGCVEIWEHLSEERTDGKQNSDQIDSEDTDDS